MIRRTLRLLRTQAPESPLPPVYVTYVAHRRRWVLLDEYRIDVPVPGTEWVWRFAIEEGFEFDLASIPRPLWTIMAPFELSIVAPLIHDYLYHYRGAPRMHSLVCDSLDEQGGVATAVELPSAAIDRATADRIFYDLMRREGIRPTRARLAYRAVRLFGPRWRPAGD